ncbi:MAG: algC 2 [Mucilaginibacter sp.]|nr:algC 2 [Mucilaginibacter sp.]
MTLITSISGIRGTIGGKPGEGLTPMDIVKFSAAFGRWVIDTTGIKKIVIGRDARISGQMVNNLVIGTLQSIGIDVIDLGLSTTPTVEIAVPDQQAGGGIILTASHNPGHWNALKLLNYKGEFISGEEGKKVLELAEETNWDFAAVDELGKVTTDDSYLQKHIDQILALPLVDVLTVKRRNLKVVIDCVNSSGGIFVPALLNAMGIYEIDVLYGEPNGDFQHNPEPLPENLVALSKQVIATGAHLGIAVDPDVDRLCFVNQDGSMFGEEYTLVAIADYILQHTPGNTVSNLSSTRALSDVTVRLGCNYAAAAVGEVNVVTKMKETNAVIGGEGNGGIIYPELHYGRDALVGIALFLSYFVKTGKTMSQLKDSYPQYYMSKNKIELTEDLDLDLLLKMIKGKYDTYPCNTVDGLKIDFEKGWVHLRKSNTEPIIRIYAEADSEDAVNQLVEKVKTAVQLMLPAKSIA